MRMFDKMAGSKITTLCGLLQNFIFIRRVPPYHHILGPNFDDFQKKASMLPKVFIYKIIHGSG